MFVVLDSNVFVSGDFWLRGNDWAWLTQECTAGRLALVVPEIVIREAVNKYRERVERLANKMNATVDELRRLRALAPGDRPSVADDHVEIYERELRAHVMILKGLMPGFDEVPHERVVRRALDRRKPFGQKDAGYRDTLVWEAVLEVAGRDRVDFVTDNIADFASTDQGLHEDLKADLLSIGQPEDRVVLHRTLKDFVKLQSAYNAELAAGILRDLASSQELQAQFTEELERAVSGWNAYGLPEPENVEEIFGADVSPESVDVHPVAPFEAIEVSDARSLAEGPALVEVTAVAETEITGLMHKADYFSDADEDRIRVVDPEWNEHYMEVAVTILMRFIFEARYDESARELREARAVSVEPAEVPPPADA